MDIEILKRAIGRPPKFANPEVMVERFFEYVESLEEVKEVKDRKGKVLVKGKKETYPTITGLSLYLGFADKHTLYQYGKKPEFSHQIKLMRTFVEKGWEEGLRGRSATGSIFALKCGFKWRETSNDGEDSTDIDVSM